MVSSATRLQSVLRGALARAEVDFLRLSLPTMDPNVAATVIQCMARCWFARKSVDIERTYRHTLRFASHSAATHDHGNAAPSRQALEHDIDQGLQDNRDAITITASEAIAKYDKERLEEIKTSAARNIQRVRRGAAARKRSIFSHRSVEAPRHFSHRRCPGSDKI